MWDPLEQVLRHSWVVSESHISPLWALGAVAASRGRADLVGRYYFSATAHKPELVMPGVNIYKTPIHLFLCRFLRFVRNIVLCADPTEVLVVFGR